MVSFLGIRVYTAGIYVSKEALKDVQNGRVDAFKVRSLLLLVERERRVDS